MSRSKVKGVSYVVRHKYPFFVRGQLPGKGQKDLSFDFYRRDHRGRANSRRRNDQHVR